MGKNILLINDLPGYGNVALSAAMPVFSHMGHHVYNLPTALVSNTLDYGAFEILETTKYMENAISVWEKLGFTFDAISTGFIVSEAQAELVSRYCQEQKHCGTLIFSDPIMGDVGHLYNGITEKTVAHMRQLVAVSDYTTPNYTEAAYLTGQPYHGHRGLSASEIEDLLQGLRTLGAGSLVVTSAKVTRAAWEQYKVDGNRHFATGDDAVETPCGDRQSTTGDDLDAVLGYDAADGSIFVLPFENIPVRFPGTGDLFSALFASAILDGHSMVKATANAMAVVKKLIEANLDSQDTFKGIQIENNLNLLTTPER